MPQVSVIIPTYNRAKYVTMAIDSVLTQTYTDYEIIVVDDGSTDNTQEVLRPYMDKIHYIFQSNKGVSAARNTGIRAATGEWIAFLDSDDLWLPEKLEVQLNAACLKNVIYSHHAEWFIDNEDNASLMNKCQNVSWPKTDKDGFVLDPILSVTKSEPYMTPALLCHRSCFEQIGYFEEELTAGEDEDWLSRASMQFKFHYLSDTLARIRYHQSQTGLNTEKSVRSLIKVFGRMCFRLKGIHRDAYQAAKGRLARKMSHLSNILCKQNKRREAIVFLWKAYLTTPSDFKYLIKVMFIAMRIK